jgi:hypothetical protein
MGYRICIRCEATGETVLTGWHDDEWGDDAEFLWTDGNYGCDCNLGHMFHHARGEDDVRYPCGFSQFTPVHAELSDGTIVEICS